jgi:dUTP pyrophosphatase
MNVQIKRVRKCAGLDLPLPDFKSAAAAGIDLMACIDKPILLQPGQVAKIPTGFAFYIGDSNVVALMTPRSGLGTKGLVLGNLTGVVDADYQGELNIIAWNRLDPDVRDENGWLVDPVKLGITINPGDRIAQLLFVPVLHPQFTLVEEFTERTERGVNGFGSTGIGERFSTQVRGEFQG